MRSLEELLSDFSPIVRSNTATNLHAGNIVMTNKFPQIEQAVAQAVYTALYSLGDTENVAELSKTIQTSVRRRFTPFINTQALADYRAFWGLYESGHIGETRYALFTLDVPTQSQRRSTFNMTVNFKPSRLVTPLTKLQSTPGPTGKSVQARHIFYNKAMVMEYGLPTQIAPIGGGPMVFESPRGKLIFRSSKAGALTKIIIDHSNSPSKGQLRRTVASFFSVAESVSLNIAEKHMTKVANAAERASLVNININQASDARARAVAKAVAAALIVEEV